MFFLIFCFLRGSVETIKTASEMTRALRAATAALLLLLLATVTLVEGQGRSSGDAPDGGEMTPVDSETNVTTRSFTFRLSGVERVSCREALENACDFREPGGQ